MPSHYPNRWCELKPWGEHAVYSHKPNSNFSIHLICRLSNSDHLVSTSTQCAVINSETGVQDARTKELPEWRGWQGVKVSALILYILSVICSMENKHIQCNSYIFIYVLQENISVIRMPLCWSLSFFIHHLMRFLNANRSLCISITVVINNQPQIWLNFEKYLHLSARAARCADALVYISIGLTSAPSYICMLRMWRVPRVSFSHSILLNEL